jgi:valyl-tRNA synthetase
LLKEKGYNSDRIQKTIDRYEKAETLEEEANDAVELLKEYKATKQEKLLDEQKKVAADTAIKQQNFFENVQNNIKSLDNVRGIKISSKEKSDLLDYIFKPESDGLTKYQKEYMGDIKNLIESAYFTKQGDALINEAKKKGSSDAYKEFHQKLKANKGKRSKNSGSLESGSDSDLILSSLSKSLLNK